MRRISLSAAVLLAVVTGPLSGCAHLGNNHVTASRSSKIEAKYDLARLAESDRQFDKARESYEQIYKKDPSNAEVCHRLGIVHAKQSNYEAAKRYLNEAHKLNPSNPEILNDLGYACYLSDDLKAAEIAFDKVLKVAPDNKRATNNMALVLGSQGRFDESLRMFRQVNGEAEAHSNVAYLYAQHGEGKKALEHYSRALTLKPDLKSAGNAMLEIASLQQKMDSDRAQLAQQQQQETRGSVAQVAGRAQPKVYQELKAARAVPEPAAESFTTPTLEVAATPAPRAAQATPVAKAKPQANDFEQFTAEAPVKTNTTSDDAFFDETDSQTPELQPVATRSGVARNTPSAVVPAPLPVTDEPTLTNDFEESSSPTTPVAATTTAEALPAVINPSRSAQSLANVADIVVPDGAKTTAVDFVALCPQASDKVKPYLSQLNSHQASQMKPALHKLGELAADGVSAAPAIRAAMTNENAYVRIHAALALWRIEQNSQDTVAVFVDGMRHTDANVRSFAATALAMGPQVEDVVAPLTAALADPNAFVRLHAAETLYKHPGHEAVAAKTMVEHLSDKDANVRWLATFIIGEALPKSPEAVQGLTQALRDTDHRIRAGAAFALGGLGADAQAALPELKQMSADTHPEVRKSAEEAIRDIEQNSAQASVSK